MLGSRAAFNPGLSQELTGTLAEHAIQRKLFLFALDKQVKWYAKEKNSVYHGTMVQTHKRAMRHTL